MIFKHLRGPENYNLGLNKNAGTMSTWTKSGSSSTTRYLFASQGSNNEILHVYIDTSNKVNVAVRDSLDNWIVIVKSDASINTTAWNFIALEWKVTAQGLQCTLNLNGINKVGSAASYKNFTDAQTSIGSYIDGTYAVNGLVDEFIYSSIALGSEKIDDIYKKQRGKYLAEETVKNTYSYENDKIKSITNNGFNYNFVYNPLGSNTEVKVGEQNLITNTYEDRTGKLLGSTYGNGQKTSLVYDSADRVIARKYNEVEKFTYGYDASG